MKILTIIVSYNFEKWIERCLGSLKASSHPTDIIVIDNCSNDRTVEIIKTQYTYVRLIENHANLAYIIHSGFISGYQNRYGDNLKPPTNVYHRMTA